MATLKRAHVYNLRSEIHAMERTLKSKGRNQKDESERDLIATACVSLWDLASQTLQRKAFQRLLSCLTRLTYFRKEWESARAYAVWMMRQ